MFYQKISYFILKCVVNYLKIELNGSEHVNKNEIINRVINFFSKNKNIELLWISLADKLKKYNRNMDNWR